MSTMTKKNKKNYLDKIPKRNSDLEWSEENGIITIHLTHKGFYSKIAQKFFHTPKKSDVHLDEYGSFVWNQIDGERTIFEIGECLQEAFGEEAEPLYGRLSKFFYILKEEKYIEYKKDVRSKQ